MADDAGGESSPGDVPVRLGADVDGVLQARGNGAVVLRGDEEDAVGGFDRAPEARVLGRGGLVGDLRVVVVEVVEREISDLDYADAVVVREVVDDVARDLAGVGASSEAADEDGDVLRHGSLSSVRVCAGAWQVMLRSPSRRR